MQSDADDADTYLALAPEGRHAVPGEMRDACRTLLAGFDESMRYGIPACSRDGVTEIAWASQKRHIALFGYGVRAAATLAGAPGLGRA